MFVNARYRRRCERPYFTGSQPPLPKGWQRSIRQMPISVPLIAPRLRTASMK